MCAKKKASQCGAFFSAPMNEIQRCIQLKNSSLGLVFVILSGGYLFVRLRSS